MSSFTSSDSPSSLPCDSFHPHGHLTFSPRPPLFHLLISTYPPHPLFPFLSLPFSTAFSGTIRSFSSKIDPGAIELDPPHHRARLHVRRRYGCWDIRPGILWCVLDFSMELSLCLDGLRMSWTWTILSSPWFVGCTGSRCVRLLFHS